jgi:hypothetical protein
MGYCSNLSYQFGTIPNVENLFEVRFDPMASLAKGVGTLDCRGDLPLYQELQGPLRKITDRRILGPEDALPSEHDLTVKLAVSRPRPAIQVL